MREIKKHWRRDAKGSFCGLWWPRFANSKRKVTCKNCLKAMGVKK